MSDDQLDKLDYYTLLGLEQTASADEVRTAFHTFALKFHPDRHVGGAGDKIERAAEIYRRGAEAYRVLLDGAARKSYDAGLAQGHMRYDAKGEDESKTRRPKGGKLQALTPKARPFAHKARMALKKEDWQQVKLNLQIALQHEPDNEEFRATLETANDKLKKPRRD